jgi:hypothetical protein
MIDDETFDPSDLIGMTKDEAYTLLSDYGYTLRIAKEDGKYTNLGALPVRIKMNEYVSKFTVTLSAPEQEVDMKRFNLSLQDGKVVEINGVG